MNVRRAYCVFTCAAFLFCANGIPAQQQVPLSMLAPRLANGINLYGEGRWGDAIVELRRSQSETNDMSLRAEAQFWIAMSEFSAGDYQSALHDFDESLRIDPRSRRVVEISYHKARALFYLGRYNEALPLFKQYSDSMRIDGRYINGIRMDDWTSSYNASSDSLDEYNRKAAAIYWIGECLYALEQYDDAEAAFNTVVTQFTRSHKYETSVNRIALIKEKRIQAGLLDIVKWNQESTRQGATSQTQNQRDSAYQNYQQQLGTILGSGTVIGADSTPESVGSGRLLVAPGVTRRGQNYDPATLSRLLSIKTTALEMMERLVSFSNNYEIIDGGMGISVSPTNGRGTLP
ncbi:MAG: tetratricopeptide repeat protein [Spirochaetaceae bacterium]|jgi:tetratricopeptide (TPR) repeat protein|nr:tetratricopeptide repeat protein [Spirochaetaceae bacterium]